MTYSEKLKDPRWQKKRLEIMNRDSFTCQVCYSETDTLNVHHLVYFKNTEPWDYINDHLVTLCENCHKTESSININKAMADLMICKQSLIYILALLKQIIPTEVNSKTATEQAIFSYCCKQLDDLKLDEREFFSDASKFRDNV